MWDCTAGLILDAAAQSREYVLIFVLVGAHSGMHGLQRLL